MFLYFLAGTSSHAAGGGKVAFEFSTDDEKLPLSSFITNNEAFSEPEFSGRSVRSTCNSTVSPGWKPEPLIVAVEPGG